MAFKPDRLAIQLRSKVFRHMLVTRGWKYRSFLCYLRLFKYVAFAPLRGEFLESYYTLMRYLDDIVDGDMPLPQGFLDESDYLAAKIRFSNDPAKPNDEVDLLMIHCFELAQKFGANFHSETKDILDSLMFDARRRGKWIIFSKEELVYHFHLLDIRGTIRATLKVFKDDPEKYKFLEPLGTACRYQYDIEDFEADIAAGYVNIPTEDCDFLGIKQEDLRKGGSPGVNTWLYLHAEEGMSLLAKHRKIVPKGKFSLLERIVFKVVYELPARQVFRKLLSKAPD